jgi:serine/threonine-protein kinase HipA
VFNILCGNTDDHARNHAAFWDGKMLSLTPAYDICSQARAGNEASHAMLILGDTRMSKLSICLQAAPHYLLSNKAAEQIVEKLRTAIESHWDEVCDEAKLSVVDKNRRWQRQFLNPFAFED